MEQLSPHTIDLILDLLDPHDRGTIQSLINENGNSLDEALDAVLSPPTDKPDPE